MNTKLLLGAIVGGLVAFLLGWLIFGMVLMSYYEAHSITYEGMMKESPNPVGLFIANLAYGAVLAIVMHWSKMVGMMKGAVIGAVLGGLITCSYDLFFFSMMNWYKDITVVIVDIIVNIVFGAVIGGVVGWVMGMGKKADAAAA
jgi:hypothetical protein